MHPLLNIANRAARAAGTTIVRALERLDTIQLIEKQHNDFVTEVDQQAERIIIETIRKTYPNHAILAEESGSLEGNEITWIIDPLDGTTNFIHGFPHFAVSIAIKEKNRIEHGLIYDPLRHEVFTTTRGAGAQLNNRRIRVSSRSNLQGSLIGTGLPVRHPEQIAPCMKLLESLIPQVAGIRRAGSAALDLAYVAAGRLDGYWEFNLAPWDIAAGALMVQEAGGLVTDSLGGDDYVDSGNIITGNPKIFKQLLQAIHSNAGSTSV